jgi:hypothetical protein
VVDGGVLNNYPINVFDANFIGDTDVSDEAIANSKTVGLKLVSGNAEREIHVDSAPTYAKAFMHAVLGELGKAHIRTAYYKRSMLINTHGSFVLLSLFVSAPSLIIFCFFFFRFRQFGF